MSQRDRSTTSTTVGTTSTTRGHELVDRTRAGAARATARTAAVLAGLVALVHLVEAPEYLEEETYIGVLFLVGAVVLGAVAVALWRRPSGAAWQAGALVTAGMLVAGVLSRTTGLPSFKESEWEPVLVVCLVLEAAFLLLYVLRGGAADRR